MDIQTTEVAVTQVKSTPLSEKDTLTWADAGRLAPFLPLPSGRSPTPFRQLWAVPRLRRGVALLASAIRTGRAGWHRLLRTRVTAPARVALTTLWAAVALCVMLAAAPVGAVLDDVTFAVSATPSAVPEGETATVTVAISNGVTFEEDQTITLALSGTASSDDYEVKPKSLRLTLPAGESSATVEMEGLEDDEEEEAETVTITASHGGVLIGSATVTITSISHDATLSALNLSGIGTSSGAETSYSVYVEEAVKTTTVTATASHPEAEVSIEPGVEVSLAEGENEITVTVTAEDGLTTETYTVTVVRFVRPLTASVRYPPVSHVGSGTFLLRVSFSEPLSISFKTLKEQCFQVINGEVRNASRVFRRDDLWDIEVAPSSAADVAVMLPQTTDCAAAGAVCTESGKPLSNSLAVLIPGPANNTTPATGLLSISGPARVGQTLTADTSGITDPDGLPNSFTYQWYRFAANGTTFEANIGTNANTYTLTTAEAGKTMRVRAMFTDNGGTEETLVSAATAPVAATVPSAPVGLAVATSEGRERELTLSWSAPESDGGSEVTGYKVQWKSGTEAYDGSEMSTRQAAVSDPPALSHTLTDLTVGTAYTVRVLAVNDAGDGAAAEAEATVQDRVASTLTGAAVDGAGLTLTFSEALNQDLALAPGAFTVSVAGTARTVDEVALSARAVVLTLASAVVSGETVTVDYTVSTGAGAAPLRDAAGNAVAGFTGEAVTNDTPVPENTAPTGLPTISGTAEVSKVLTASVDGIEDADGLTGATFAYQWVSNDGNADADIAEATQRTYRVAAADADRTLKVRVTYTDDGNTEEMLESAATASVLEPISLSVADAQVQEGPGATLDFVIRLSRAAVKRMTVYYRAYDGTATAGADYTAVDASVVFSPGDVEKTVSIAVLEDAHDEGSETVKFWLWGWRGFSSEQVTDSYAVGTITDNGGTEETLVSAATAPVGLAVATSEGRERELTLSWSAPESDGGSEVTGYKVQWKSGTEAYDGSEMSTRQAAVSDPPALSHTLTDLTVGTAYTVRVLAVNDAGDGAAAEAEATVQDRVASTLTGAAVDGAGLTLTFSEALNQDLALAPGAFTVSVAGTARTVDEVALSARAVVLTLASAVVSGETVTVDYTVSTGAGAAPLRDAAGNAVAGFTGEAVTNDTPVPENTAPTGLPTISGTAEVGKVLTASVDGIEDADGLTGATFAYQWVSNDGNADADIAEATQRTYRVAAADVDRTLKVRVTYTDDGNTEEMLESAATASVLEPISLSVADAQVQEGPGATLDFVIRLSRAAVKRMTVYYRAYDGTATAGADYTAVDASVVFSPGDVEKTVSIAVLEDAHDEGSETVKFWLWGWRGFSSEQVTDSYAVGTITDNGGTGALTASFSELPAAHGGPGSEAFVFKLQFSEAPQLSYKVLRDDAISVSGGTVRKAKRLNPPSNTGWEITVKPSGWDDVTVTLAGGRACGAAGAVCTDDGKVLSNTAVATVQGLPALSVADAQVTEAAGATVDFVVRLSRAVSGTVTVAYATADGSATAGADYTSASGVLTFSAGQTTKTVPVTVLDDVYDDDGETFTLRLSNAAGARIADSEATGTIENSDPLPKGWLSRFGRTSAAQVVGLLDARFDEARAPASQLTLGGRSVTVSVPGGHSQEHRPGRRTGYPDADPFAALASRYTPDDAARGRADLNNDPTALHADLSAGPAPIAPAVGAGGEATLLERLAWGLLTRSDWSVDRRQFLSRSSFNLSLSALGGETDGAALETARLRETPGHWSMWGRGALTRFAGQDTGVSLDGDVLTGLLGVDYSRGRWLAGLALAYNDGDGTYRASDSGAAGTLDSTLVSVHPYLRYVLTPRLSAWGALGYGRGTLTLRPERGAGDAGYVVGDGLKSVPGESGESDPIETGMQLGMGALGLRGTLFASATTELALKSDLLWVRTASDATDGLQSVDGAAASRVRLLLSGTHRHTLVHGADFTPSFELGLRYDDGDAETGAGVELGGGLHYTDPVLGLTVETRARALLAHEDGSYEEWGVGGSLQLDPGRLGRGLSLRLASGWGARASAADALWQRQDTAGLAQRPGLTTPRGRIKAEWGYGLDVPWTHGLLTPYGSVELAGGGSRTTRLGWRFELGRSLSLSLAGERRETALARPEHGLMLRTTLPW